MTTDQTLQSLPTSWNYVESRDLTRQMIQSTISSYDEFAKNYSQQYEFDWEMIQRTKHDYLHKLVSLLKVGDTVLVVGVGTGRDILELSQRGMTCLGIDNSYSMISESVKNGVRSPLVVDDLRRISIVPLSFDGVLVDSALEHIPKREVPRVFGKLIKATRIDGVLMLRFRLGDGRVFKVSDEVGERFFTSFTEDEVSQLINSYTDEITVIERKIVDHKISIRPAFLSLLLKRTSIS